MASRNDSHRDSRKDRKKDDTEDQSVAINRTTKVIKGGHRVRSVVVVIVGDRKSRVGSGTSKVQEAPEAIRKAVEASKKRMIRVPVVGTTIPYEVMGYYGPGGIMLKPAEAGSDVTAGGAVRIIISLTGISDIISKSPGSNTPINATRVTMDGLNKSGTRGDVLKLRESVKSLED